MESSKKGWIVVLAGTGINLALGVLYAWSIFSKNLTDVQGWTKMEASLPYTIAILMFALMMTPAGKLQDKYGARIVASIGGALTGLGLIFASIFTDLTGLIVSFGLLAGTGIGLGYASTTPAAMKWFAKEKKGLITGIVVSGFGLASVYIAPLTKYLIDSYGIFPSFRILGISFLVIAVALAQLLKSPSPDFNPNGSSTSNSTSNKKLVSEDYTWKEMLRTPQFYQLWLMFACGALAGLMIIGHLSKIATLQLGVELGFYLVALIAIFNAGGRVITGVVSDKLGRTKTMMVMFIIQGGIMTFFSQLTNFTTLAIGAAIVGFSYGACLAVFPSAIGDYYGTKNLGLNYGILFSAWGVGGVIGPLLAGWIADSTGTYELAFKISAGLCIIAAAIAWKTHSPVAKSSESFGSLAKPSKA